MILCYHLKFLYVCKDNDALLIDFECARKDYVEAGKVRLN